MALARLRLPACRERAGRRVLRVIGECEIEDVLFVVRAELYAIVNSPAGPRPGINASSVSRSLARPARIATGAARSLPVASVRVTVAGKPWRPGPAEVIVKIRAEEIGAQEGAFEMVPVVFGLQNRPPWRGL